MFFGGSRRKLDGLLYVGGGGGEAVTRETVGQILKTFVVAEPKWSLPCAKERVTGYCTSWHLPIFILRTW
jgi:hypothetical protein